MRRLPALTLALSLALLATVLVAGCGGASSPGHKLAIGRPEIATSNPGSVGIAKQTEREGVVHGEPELRPGEEAPAVGLADKVAGCTGTDLLPTAENLNDVRAATLCLLNAERAARGLAPLRLNAQLAQAALVHSRDMVARSYFAHDAPPTPASTFVDRIRAAGYLRTGAGWTIGENLAWGGGDLATAGAIMDAWMASPHHRANILTPSFRETGIAIVLGTPTGSSDGATYSNEFGYRRLR